MSDKKPLVNYSGEIKEIASTDVIPVVNGGVDPTAWTSWTPSWTGITIGNASVTARYKQIGKTVFASIDVIFGTTTSVSGAAQYVSLPVTSVSRISTSIMGSGVGLLSVFLDMAAWYDTTTRSALVFRTSSTAGTASSFSASTVSWANTHKLSLNLKYEAA